MVDHARVQETEEKRSGSTEVGHIEIGARIERLGRELFCNCRKLDSVTFASGSRLKKIGPLCFSKTEISEFLAPPGLRNIDDSAFYECKQLKRVTLNDGLVTIGGRSDDSNDYNNFSGPKGVF